MIELEVPPNLIQVYSIHHRPMTKYGSLLSDCRHYIGFWPNSVEEWVDENIRSETKVFRKKGGPRPEAYVCFEDDRDALLFKMRWL